MKDVVLGLDGGGTQTRALITDMGGASLGRGVAGACNLAAVMPKDCFSAALDAAQSALEEAGLIKSNVRALCAGVAGASFEARRRDFLEQLESRFPRAQCQVIPDYAIALTGATNGEPGVIVIAGTGSAAYGENEAGDNHKTGAYGYLIDDAGSGYGVGRATLAAILRAVDGTGESTAMAAYALEMLKISSMTEIVPGVYGGEISRVMIARLSRVAAAAASDGDPVAQGILMRTGGALAHLVQGVTQQLFRGSDSSFPVARIGGLWNAGVVLTDVFERSLHRFAPSARLIEPKHSPVEGAIQRALAMLL